MKIHYMSDLHLEFAVGPLLPPKGDILILAGDIVPIAASRHPVVAERMRAFFTDANNSFDRIFYLPGNHEPYGSNISKQRYAMRKMMAPYKKVEFLNDFSFEAHELGDNVVLTGGTLWTDFNNGQAHDYIMGEGRFHGPLMNDFRQIRIGAKGRESAFTTKHALQRFLSARSYIFMAAHVHRNKTVIVATHHAPSYRGTNPVRGGNLLDAAYASDLEKDIRDHPSIRYWIHGHTHIRASYQIGQCTVLANCRGYPHDPSYKSFMQDGSNWWFDPVKDQCWFGNETFVECMGT